MRGLPEIARAKISIAFVGRRAGILFLFVVLVSSLNCGQTEGGGSGGLGPSDEPYLIEGVLCSDISDTQQPVAIADNFPIGSKVFLWLHWANITGDHTIEVFWYDPDGEEQHHELFELSTREERYITWFFLETSAGAKSGEWLVSLFLDGEFVRSYVFQLF